MNLLFSRINVLFLASLLDREMKSLFYANDLVLLSPTDQGKQQQLDMVAKYWKKWPLAVNMKNKYQFIINNHISWTQYELYLPRYNHKSFNMAANTLKEKAWRVLNVIKSNFIISKFQLKYGSPLHCMLVKSGVHSAIIALLVGTNVQQNLYIHFILKNTNKCM